MRRTNHSVPVCVENWECPLFAQHSHGSVYANKIINRTNFKISLSILIHISKYRSMNDKKNANNYLNILSNPKIQQSIHLMHEL